MLLFHFLDVMAMTSQAACSMTACRLCSYYREVPIQPAHSPVDVCHAKALLQIQHCGFARWINDIRSDGWQGMPAERSFPPAEAAATAAAGVGEELHKSCSSVHVRRA
jgi:hypothetical protein